MSGRPAVTALGVAAAAGVGYYLYTAGGNPKVAEKQMEADAHKAAAKIQHNLPTDSTGAQQKGKEMATRASAAVDKSAADIEAKAKEAYNKAAKEANKTIDEFDVTVEKKAAEAKKGISSWFGGK